MGLTTFNIFFYVRKYRLLKDGKAPLLMRITVNGKRWDSALQVGIDINNWDAKKEKAIGNDEGSNTINSTSIIKIPFKINKLQRA